MGERTPVIAGNWKLNKTIGETLDFINAFLPLAAGAQHCDIVICPPFTALSRAAERLRGSRIALGAQDCYWEEAGAFTGEVSPVMLKDAGCRYCIVGHSERRQYFGETDEGVNKKALALLRAGLTPIICVGELLAQREAGQTEQIVAAQIRGCLKGFSADQIRASIIAYEPVWAIGTGRAATPEMAQDVHVLVRNLLGELAGAATAADVRILYGGSVTPQNVKALMAQPDIDGALVGGASLKVESFSQLVHYQD
ncbi:MAG: triose-phosphate isomerase [Candidatus Sumerlaeia bacterium]